MKDYTQKEENVQHNGGTRYYLAPELLVKGCKFTKSCDVFACGIIMMELILMRSARDLYQDMWPKILDTKDSDGLWVGSMREMATNFLSQCLDRDPARRSNFDELYAILEWERDKLSSC